MPVNKYRNARPRNTLLIVTNATATVFANKIHLRLLKSVSGTMKRNRVFMVPKSLLKNRDFTVEKLRQIPHQAVFKVHQPLLLWNVSPGGPTWYTT